MHVDGNAFSERNAIMNLLTLPSASEAIGNNQQQAKFVYTKNKKTIIAK